jgi:hypothetical protein
MKRTRTTMLLLVLLVGLHRSSAQGDSTSISANESAVAVIASDLLFVAPAGILFLLNHELGHYAVASLAGASNVRMGLMRTGPEGNHKLGWSDWSGQMSHLGRSSAFLGGVAFSRGLAEGIDWFEQGVTLSRLGQRFFSMLFLMTRFDFSRYVVLDALVSSLRRPGSDINFFVTELAGRGTVKRTLVYGALLGVALVDLIQDWERIGVHWNVVTGGDIRASHALSQLHIHVRPAFTSRSLALRIDGSW